MAHRPLCKGMSSGQQMGFGSPICTSHLTHYAAEPFSPSQGDPSWTSGCDRHGHLNIIEETVEKTVEHLEAEVKGLLDLLEGLAWNLPERPFSPAPDLLEQNPF
ncbi:placenta-specific protein 9 isoform X2 [Tenrec ecaudatus]|uniref:placenta-specific protein 9 isoform X2 n=1 Tax=Tenrec ecaudatus TaxID=94439 RepID=UPI003F5A8D76